MKSVSLSALLVAVAAVVLVSGTAFGYFFGMKKAPAVVENLKATVTASAAPAKPPKFLANIVGKTPETQMREPLSVAVADNGRVFVADTGNGRIQAYDPNGEFLFQFGQKGEGESNLEMPATLAWHNGRLYVGDLRRNAILEFDGSGRFVQAIKGKDLGVNLSPLAFAFDSDTLYAASAPGYIYAIDPTGKLVATIGKPGGPEGYLGYPNGLAIVGGQIVVADSNNQRVQVFDKSGNLVSIKTDLGLSLPRGMAVDRFGRLLVVDTFGHNVVALDKDLKPLFRFGDRGLEEGQFNFPNQLATDDVGRVYIADRENNRVVVFGY